VLEGQGRSQVVLRTVRSTGLQKARSPLKVKFGDVRIWQGQCLTEVS
jgi:hypothetical protein